MLRLLPLILGVLLLAGHGSGAWAVSPKAADLRQANGLSTFTPPEKFLAGNFVAEEMNPAFIFGTVKDFVASRKGPTAWLIEEGAKNLPATPGKPEATEYTLFLEEDCPDKVVYYVFVDQSSLTPQQWLEWRRHFHKSKADPQFGGAKGKLEQACQEGCGVSGELRFLQVNGELLGKSPEEYLRSDLRFAPIYDLNQQKKIPK
jgi:hypothetical protein